MNRSAYVFTLIALSYQKPLRKSSVCKKCEKRKFECKDESTMIKLPISLIEANLDRLDFSIEEDGKVSHWHIVFYKDLAGHITWLFSKTGIEEISIDEYLMV